MSILEKLLSVPKLRSTVGRMIEDAKIADDERRRNGRYPYFQPVMIQMKDSPELYSAFTRDVSLTGIGLLHWMPIQPQMISVMGKLMDGTNVRVAVKIAWCVPCGEGWYISGGRFTDVENF
ncbi:MAG: PilZ domain-containing protein [Planctomycetales bacterium]|nr:PilZ domain-containing protein [Planctomycetales bacterium]MCA9170613.1 PilZ domain-containing protein [Planctomycetales bacterium]